jgi:TolB-like protein
VPAISKNARVCKTCGSPIETTSAGDLGCIACLIATGLDAEAEQSDTAFASAPDQLGAYTIEHHADGSVWELGRGAMGVTYRAIDKALDRPVALKIINTERGSHSAEARERFMREARAAGALRHPNVATVYQFGVREETGQFFYAMELVEGETLEERVRRLGPIDVLTTIDIALQVTAALEAAEERGLVHRDLKPGNLMLVSPNDETPRASTERGGYSANMLGIVATVLRRRARRTDRGTNQANRKLVVKVIDFGVAKAVAEKTNAMALTHGGFVGTPAFASPEQFTNAPVDVRSDIYSLGATLWFLLTGHMLFSGRTIEEIRDARGSKPLPIDQLETARVPHRFISLLTSMLAIEPAARPASARELSARLQAIRASITGRGKTARRLVLAAAIVALATIVAVQEFHSFATKATPSAIPEKSIAVLPFENLSSDPNSAYFSEGIQEEILTRLAKIADLKVISRTSTQRYHSKPVNLAEVAKQLGVANILEGSVQKAADQVRVNVQLINAQTDSHLWADSYDRKLTDILGVESEIAKRIAESLQAKLTGREEQGLAVKPTNNAEAYDAYLRGLAFDGRKYDSPSFYSSDLAVNAAGFYERAVQLDPNFAIAWAQLSRADTFLYRMRVMDTTFAARRDDAAKRALENAQKLEPNLPETLLALGYYQFWVLRDFGAAKITLERVRKMLPSNSEVPRALALIAQREGHWDQSVAYSEQALALDPRNLESLRNAADTYGLLRQFPAALKLYDRILDITPNDPDAMAAKAGIYQVEGNLQEAARLLSDINEKSPNPSTFLIKIGQLRLERNHGEAIRLLQARLAQSKYAFEYDDYLELAFTQRLAGDTVGAKITAQQARNTFEQIYRDQPDNYGFAARLSQACAVLGKKDLALQAAEQAVMILPSVKDAVNGPDLEENLAFIQTMVGENSRAISTLTHLLRTPYNSWFYMTPITPALLRLDPIWDPLRADPAFQKLCEEKIDKSIAVLPFENLSSDPNNRYFAEGIQEEILTRLAKIADLKVISRTSTSRYTSKPDDIAEIARQLGVANILEGSVQKEADQVRVNVQLINAQSDSHLWADSYDRKLTDMLGVESEIAKGIAESLQATLSGREQQALAVKPTNNPEAYDAYLRGLAFGARGFSLNAQACWR